MDAHTMTQALDGGSRLQDLAWMVLGAPLVASLGTTFYTRGSRALTLAFNLSGVILSFLLSLVLLLAFAESPAAASPFAWLPIDGLGIRMGLMVDRLSLLMAVVVTGVASAVMAFSTGYMNGDRDFFRFFRTLSFFVFSMLGIVLSDNFVMMFVFWELVGVSSYLLIGFWHERPAAADAAKKAFLANRVGDFGFILGILVVWSALGTVDFSKASALLAANPGALGSAAGLAGVLVFLGAMGKSAQFPLHVWLPDAMEGPTPVSALIHAATMVAAGVYMLCRVFFLYTAAPGWPDALGFMGSLGAGTLVGWTGGITALMAALIALQQNDIKRILAYSTLSQLGIMVMGVGAGAATGNPGSAMFHLTTHAFFKALLFLAAGSVIHACHHEQDIWKMGGLRERMPLTFAAFVIGTAALVGLPLFSGFYSKDEVLATLLEGAPVLFGVGVIVSVLTAIYMMRLVLVVFLGRSRGDSAGHAEESPRSMTVPLMVLAVPSVALAWLPVGDFFSGHYHAGGHGSGNDILFGPFSHNPMAALFGLGAVLLGLSLAWSLYAGADGDPLAGRAGRWARAVRHRFYFDELYDGILVPMHDLLAWIADATDRWLVRGFVVRGTEGLTDLVGRTLRLVQTGNLQTYTFLFVAGAAVVALIVATQ